MNKTILSLLLTILLLLLSAAAMAASDPDNYVFDISEGKITLTDGSMAGTIKVTYGASTEKDGIDPSQIITVTGSTTQNELHIETATPVTIKASDLTIDRSQTQYAYAMAIDGKNGKGKVTLILEGVNTFKSGREKAAISVNAGRTLIIKGDGSVYAKAFYEFGLPGAGIGGDGNHNGGTIIIESGTVEAVTEGASAGIGGGGPSKSTATDKGNFASVIILGGKVTATNHRRVTNFASDIGLGYHGTTGCVIIMGTLGQDVTATNGRIGYSTGIVPDGNGILQVKSATTMPVDLTVAASRTMNIPEGNTLTIPAGRTLTIDGALTIDGTLNVTGTLSIGGTVSGSGSIEPASKRLTRSAPPTPTVAQIAGNTVTLNEIDDSITGAQYSRDGIIWQDSPVFEGVNLSAGCTFYARYKETGIYFASAGSSGVTAFAVKLNPNGGTIVSGDVTGYTCGVGATLPTDVQKTGHTFAGWYADKNCTGSPVTAIGAGETGAKTYWAKWTVDQYTVALHPNGGTIAPGHDVTGYTYGVGAALPTAEYVTRPGYTFAGWYDNKALTGSPVIAIGADETGVKRYWAGWTAVPVITAPAEDRTVTVYEGERATMTITAQHAAHYQWQMSTDGGATWADCGEDSPAFTTAPAKLADDGTRYRCTVTGSGALEQPPQEEQPGQEGQPGDMVRVMRSAARTAGDPLTTDSPVFTLRVIRRDALPQTGDSAHPGLWLALGIISVAALAALLLRGRKRGGQ